MSLHLLINALSSDFGGGSVVAEQLARHLRLARPTWKMSILLTAGKKAHDPLRAIEGVEVIEAPAKTASRWSRWLFENRTLGGLCSERSVNVLFQPNGMVPRGVGVPVFAHIGDPWPYLDVRDRWFDPMIAVLRRRGHRRATKTAAAMGFTSGFVMELVRQRFGGLPANSAVYYNGLPATAFAREVRPIESREVMIVTVSLVSPYKRQELVIKALPGVMKKTGLANLRYRILGKCDDVERQRLLTLASSLGVSDRVSIEGRVDQATVDEAFASARVFALPSMSESFGLPSVEAMSFGAPVVVARAGATEEVCGEAAMFIDPDDVEQLVDRLSALLTDDARATSLQRAGLENIKRFDWRVSAEQLARTLGSLCPREHE
jgi:glycosyltransferase involved in cell wall biosynthesis